MDALMTGDMMNLKRVNIKKGGLMKEGFRGRYGSVLTSKAGFTLVELAIVLVIIGIILGAVLKGQELINNAKVKKLQTQYVNGLDAFMAAYMDRRGRLPGDCNRDGLIGYVLPAAIPAAGAYSVTADPTIDYCILPTTGEGNINRVFSDLRQQDFLPRGVTNQQFGRFNLFGGTSAVAVGYVAVVGGTNPGNYNAIALYNIPTYAAQMLEASIDGTEDGNAGRIRQGIGSGTGVAWPTNKDTLVNVSYFFDRIPS
jgi:prepilin-type N-terminal cleavage/methylation domain-containing protein